MYDLTELEIELLKELYTGYFAADNDGLIDLKEWYTERGFPGLVDRSYIKLLNQYGLVTYGVIGRAVKITVEGCVEVEQENWCPEVTAKQLKMRRLLLEKGLEEWRENGDAGSLFWEDVLRYGNFRREEFNGWLEEAGLIGIDFCSYYLTSYGVREAQRLEASDSLTARWADMQTMNDPDDARRRGHLLEDLLAEVAESEGLNVETRVRSIGEENDVCFRVDFQHFLVSCKWESDPAKSEYIQSLRTRMRKRGGGVIGVIASVGGFSEPLKRLAEKQLSNGAVILLGKQGLSSVFEGRNYLKDVLLERHTQLMRTKTVDVT